MNWKETYTKIFLKSANIAIGENTLKEYMPMWWKNSRSKGTGGLRLTDDGITFIKEKLELMITAFLEMIFWKFSGDPSTLTQSSRDIDQCAGLRYLDSEERNSKPAWI